MELQEGTREPLYQIMLARYYSSSLGRFMEVDAVGGSVRNPQSWNRYSYVRSNPLRLVDPNGFLAVDANFASQYPKAAAFITNMSVRGAKEYAAYKTVGGANAGKAQVDRAFSPNAGPVFKVEKFFPNQKTGDERYGQYHSPSNTGIDPMVLNAFEAGICGSATWLEAIAKHEVAHYFDNIDGYEDFTEPGDVWEQEVYGRKIGDSFEHATDYEREQGKSSSRGSFFGPSQQPSRSPGGYVDADGTHWSGSRSVEAF